MKTDTKGFIVSGARGSRTFVAVRASELKALEASKNPSLRVLAKRVRESVEKNETYWKEKAERDRQLAEFSAKRQAEIDADPKLKAEQQKRRAAFADTVGFALGPPVKR
jgi:hypothetical protein